MSQRERGAVNPDAKWSFLLGEYFGIALRIHVSFALLLGWIGLSTWGNTGSLATVFASLVLIGLVFVFVAMHEYGHALAARHFGIGTREITLLPIGGVARLERMPDDPRQEMLVALAGPAVNVALAVGIATFMLLGGTPAASLISDGLFGGSLLSFMFRINFIMAVFNMLPALPMDGGRVFRALLASRMPVLRATRIASQLAKGLAGAMALYGFVAGNILLTVVGAFIWLASKAEYQHALMTELARQAAAQRPTGQARSFWVSYGEDPPNEWIAGPPEERSGQTSDRPGRTVRITRPGTVTDRREG